MGIHGRGTYLHVTGEESESGVLVRLGQIRTRWASMEEALASV